MTGWLAGLARRLWVRFEWVSDPVLGWIAHPEATVRLTAWPCADGCWRYSVDVEAHGIWWSVAGGRLPRVELVGLSQARARQRAQMAAERAWVDWSGSLVAPGGVR